VKSKTWDDALLADHRSYIREESAQEAFDALVDAAIELPDYETAPGWHGEIRDFAYYDVASGERPFAFIVNRSDLLFYVRFAGLRRVPGGFAALRNEFSSASENSRGEWTVRIASGQDADKLNRLLFDGQLTPPVQRGPVSRLDEIAEARAVIVGAVPYANARKTVLQQLIDSSEYAQRVAPSAWGATLFSDGFRLNVGQVEVLVLSGEGIRLNLVGEVGEAPFIGPLFVEAQYQSVPEISCAFVGTPDEFVVCRDSLKEAHLRFVERAATTQSGRPRIGTRFRDSHSEALIAFAYADRYPHTEMVFPNELQPGITYIEGARKQVWVNAFERDPKGREACLSHHGFNCAVCEFNFEDRYGEKGKGYIHVHHLRPMALTDGEYELDPIADLRPVCPNCHAMLHRGEIVLTIDELRQTLKSRSSQ
jgi:hypothetical protein